MTAPDMGVVVAADDVGHRMYGESCPWIRGRVLNGRRTAADSPVSEVVSSWKIGVFEAVTTTTGTPKANEKLYAWRKGVKRATGPNISVGGILGRDGGYVMKRGAGERFTHTGLTLRAKPLRRHVPTPRDGLK